MTRVIVRESDRTLLDLSNAPRLDTDIRALTLGMTPGGAWMDAGDRTMSLASLSECLVLIA